MSPQLAAMFAAHKTAIFGAAAAGVVGLALLQKKKSASAAAPASTSSIPGTLPAAAVVAPTAGAGYDSSSYDLYNALQSELQPLFQNQGGSVTAPAPVASSIFAPTGSGQLVRYNNGTIAEVESDGTLLGLTPDQFTALSSKGQTFTSLSGAQPKVYTTAGNLAAKNPTS